MKFKKILLLLLIIFLIFIVYKLGFDNKINYVALGDSISLGQGPYGEISYGYTDCIADYLENNHILKNYNKQYSKSGNKIEDIIDYINTDKTISFDENINIKRILRESDLVTISVGINDFLEEFNILNINNDLKGKDQLYKEIDKLSIEFEKMLILIKKYAKSNIIVVGYYNPYPNSTIYKNEIDKLVKYGNKIIKNISEKNKVQFIDIFSEFNNQKKYLPNPSDFHPNTSGYRAIFYKIKPIIDNIFIKKSTEKAL